MRWAREEKFLSSFRLSRETVLSPGPFLDGRPSLNFPASFIPASISPNLLSHLSLNSMAWTPGTSPCSQGASASGRLADEKCG